MDLAVSALTYAMDNGQPDPVKVVARERLARVKLALGDQAGALELLDGAPSDLGFESLFAEIRGNIHLANGEQDLAIASYRTALETLEDGVGNRELLIIKLEALGASAEAESEVAVDAGGGEV
jgi:predicted negative regulator of RcsB-dependent stress response